MTVHEVRALLRHLLELRCWDEEEIIRWSNWRQQRNEEAKRCHENRRRTERRRPRRKRSRGCSTRATLPGPFGNLIATDVDKGGRKCLDYFGQHVLEYRESPLVARAEDGARAVNLIWIWVDFERPTPAGEIGVGGQHRETVARHLDLGNDRDLATGSIGYQLA